MALAANQGNTPTTVVDFVYPELDGPVVNAGAHDEPATDGQEG